MPGTTTFENIGCIVRVTGTVAADYPEMLCRRTRFDPGSDVVGQPR